MAGSLGLVGFTRQVAGEDVNTLPSWMDAQPSIDKIADITPEAYSQQLSHTNFPCTHKDFYTWGYNPNFGAPRLEYTQAGCFVSMSNAEISGDMIVPFGVRQAQKIVPDNLDRVSFLPARNSNKIALVSNSYAYYQGGTPTLHLVDDWTQAFNNYQLDSYANVSRHGSSDYTFTHADGSPIDIRTNGIAFSANGQWLHASATNQSELLINTSTHEIILFAPYNDPGGYAEYAAVSNDGRYVALAIPYQGLKLYDLQRCGAANGELESRNCQSRTDVYDRLKNYTGTDDLRIFMMEFTGANNNLEVSAAVHNQQDDTWKYEKYRLSLPGSHENKYLALGDSFSSGEGAYDYRSPTDFYIDESNYNVCHQSKNSYPYVLQSLNKFEWFNSVACSGALMKDVKSNLSVADYTEKDAQSLSPRSSDNSFPDDAISFFKPGYVPQVEFSKEYQPSIATISIVGNDIGFGQIVTACILNKLTIVASGECFSERDDREAVAGLIDLKISKLSQLLTTLKGEMSGSDPKLYVLGYPKVISPKGLCGLNSPLTSSEIAFANNMVEYLDTAVKVAADGVGAQYVDVSDAFVVEESDYRLCGNQLNLAMNGVVLRGSTAKNPDNIYYSETFHPNKLGQSLMAAAAQSQTSGLTSPMPQPQNSLDELVEKRVALVGDNEKRLRDYTLFYEPNVLTSNRFSLQIYPKHKPLELNIGPGDALLPPADNQATIEFHSTPIIAGTLPIAADGSIHGSVSIPDSLLVGYHQLHVKYKDISGRTIDRYTYVYVAESENDYDGDGKPNASDPCVMGKESGVDSDKDNIDDACDDEYVSKITAVDSSAEESLVSSQSKQDDKQLASKSSLILAASQNTSSSADEIFHTNSIRSPLIPQLNNRSQNTTVDDAFYHEQPGGVSGMKTTLIVIALMIALGLIIKVAWFGKS